MRKQLIIKIPYDATSEEMKFMIDMTTKTYTPGYPLFLLPGWEYEIVELTEPMLIMNDPSKVDREEFVKAIQKANLRTAEKE